MKRKGGAFTDRPERRHLFKKPFKFPLIWQDLGLSIAYGATLGAWTFVFASGILKQGITTGLLSGPGSHPLRSSFAVGIVALAVLWILAKWNDQDNAKIDEWIESEEAIAAEPPQEPPSG